MKPGIAVTTGGDPVVTGNRIHDGKGAGVNGYDNGNGRFENNDIRGHGKVPGFAVDKGGDLTVINNRIHDNLGGNIRKGEGSKSTFESNRENHPLGSGRAGLFRILTNGCS